MEFSGFDWDEANQNKCQKHGVSIAEVESLFAGAVVILPDIEHSWTERRFRAIGKTSRERLIFVVFTERGRDQHMKIRPISARYMHRSEASDYEKNYPEL
jgi:uncharacterized DUF497 family protein